MAEKHETAQQSDPNIIEFSDRWNTSGSIHIEGLEVLSEEERKVVASYFSKLSSLIQINVLESLKMEKLGIELGITHQDQILEINDALNSLVSFPVPKPTHDIDLQYP